MTVQATALRRLMLKALQQLNERERKEFVQLYGLGDNLTENHEILAALSKKNNLLMNNECLDLFMANFEMVNSQNVTIIEEAKELKGNLDHTGFERQDSLPFTTQTSPPRECVQSDGLSGIIKPIQVQEADNTKSKLVTSNSGSTAVTDSIGDEQGQNKRPRYDFQTVAECDSTYNSEESDSEDDQQQVSGASASGNETDVISGDIRIEETDTEAEDFLKPATGEDLEFIKEAVEVSKKSGDPHTKVGAIVVKDGSVIGKGWNYLPREGLTWDRQAPSGKEEDTKYPYVTHAAVTALQNAYKAKKDPSGATIYTTMFPSSRDGVFILESEVKEVVFLEKSREWRKRYHTGATKKLFDEKIQCRQVYIPEDK